VKSAFAFAACGAALVLLTGGGCELAIGDTVPDFTCKPGGLDPCPTGQICDLLSRQCVSSCSASSPCHGGLQCNTMTGYCVDASVPPPGDGSSGDADASSNETSVGDSNVPVDTSVGDTVVPPTDSSDGACTGLLCPCGGDPECASGVCASQLDVGVGLFMAAGNIGFCTTPCCTSADCDPSLVCFAASSSASAGSYCVPPRWLMRSTTLGLATGGQSCSVDSDCRSGRCDVVGSGTCADTCCSTKQSSTECASGKTCGFGNFPGAASFDHNFTPLCGSFGTNANGDSCGQSSDCQSNLCIGGGPFGASCQDACRDSSDCAQNYSCSFDHLSGSGVYGLCFPFQTGNADGTTCHQDADCQSNFCNGQMICSNICFANSDCSQITNAHCRPEQVTISRGGGAASVLSCGI
jgi:hypothetical protein